MTDRDDYKRLATKVERIAHMMKAMLDRLPFCDPDVKDLQQAASALRAASVKAGEVVAVKPVAWRVTNRKTGLVKFKTRPQFDCPFNRERWIEEPLYTALAAANQSDGGHGGQPYASTDAVEGASAPNAPSGKQEGRTGKLEPRRRPVAPCRPAKLCRLQPSKRPARQTSLIA